MYFGRARRKAKQIVDDNVNGAADPVPKVGVVQGLGENALASKRGVAVNQQGQIFSRSVFRGAVMLGPRAADGHRVNGFQVAWIRNQMDVNLARRARFVISGRAHVVLHVAAAENTTRIDVFKSSEHLFRQDASPRGR